MALMIVGALLLGGILGLFYLKDRFENPMLARMAYHELTMRLVVVAVFLIGLGIILTVGELMEGSDVWGGATPQPPPAPPR